MNELSEFLIQGLLRIAPIVIIIYILQVIYELIVEFPRESSDRFTGIQIQEIGLVFLVYKFLRLKKQEFLTEENLSPSGEKFKLLFIFLIHIIGPENLFLVIGNSSVKLRLNVQR